MIYSESWDISTFVTLKMVLNKSTNVITKGSGNTIISIITLLAMVKIFHNYDNNGLK